MVRGYQTFADWIKDDPPPELSELIERYGSYVAIPAAELYAFWERLRRWNIRRITRHW